MCTTPVYHITPPHLCVPPVCHICPPHLCITPVHHSCAPHLCTTSVYNSCVPHLSTTPVCPISASLLGITPEYHICAPHLCAELRLASGVRIVCGSWKRLGLQPGLRTPPSAPSPGLVGLGELAPQLCLSQEVLGSFGLWKCQLHLGG